MTFKFKNLYRLESEDLERGKKMRIYMFLLFALITVVANIGYRLVWYGPDESWWAFFFDLIVVVVPLIVAFVIFTVALV
jgi:membrane protein YdbS with pleckstrin-like domain